MKPRWAREKVPAARPAMFDDEDGLPSAEELRESFAICLRYYLSYVSAGDVSDGLSLRFSEIDFGAPSVPPSQPSPP